MTGTRRHDRRKRLSWLPKGMTLAGGDFGHLVFGVRPGRRFTFLFIAKRGNRGSAEILAKCRRGWNLANAVQEPVLAAAASSQ
jgi:hypothetical protein